MREIYINEDDTEYECPYCHTETMDCHSEYKVGDEVEQECIQCGRDFMIVVL